MRIPIRANSALFYALLYSLALAVYAVVAWPHTHPPYIDSFYYVDIARNIAHGQGLTEGFVWNYLGGLPPIRHPSSEYWLPGTSLLLAPVFVLGGGYHGAALVTAAIAALCPVLAAWIGYDIFGSMRHALTMAGLTLFNGIWFHDWTSPDAFVPYAAIATLAMIVAYKGMQGRGPRGGSALYALAGGLAGLCALLRQEGVFLLLALVLAATITRQTRRLWPQGIVGAIALFALVEAPWLLHNIAVLGTPLATGGTKTLWMRSYTSFYALHTGDLTTRSYLQWGLGNIIGVRLQAALFTFSIWIFLWLIVLVPPLLLGLWQLRQRIEMRPFLVYWLMLAIALPFVFTATIQNGTLGHASGALIPFGSALIVAGLDKAALVLTARQSPARRGNGARIAGTWSILAVTVGTVVSIWMTFRTFPAHGDEYTRDVQVVAWLHQHNPVGRPVMVLDPPAFSYIDDRSYVVAPSESLSADLAVARHYGVRYWALDPIHAASQQTLYDGHVTVPKMHRVAIIQGVQIYYLQG